jgi:hypothetical protein
VQGDDDADLASRASVQLNRSLLESLSGSAVAITNTGTATASVSGVTVSGQFTQTNGCGTLAAGASCNVNVTFTPNNGLFRCGGVFWSEAQRFGAITLFPQGSAIVGAVIRDTDIFDSTYDGIQFKTGGGEMPNVAITNVRIDDSNNGGAGRNPGSQFMFSGTVNGTPVQPVVVP